jgi:hypothetical protein
MHRRLPIAALSLAVAFGAAACSSASSAVVVSVQQTSLSPIRDGAVTCGLRPSGGGVDAVVASGIAHNTGTKPLRVSVQVAFINPKHQALFGAGTQSGGTILPGHSWRWTTTSLDEGHAGVTDTRLARCIVTDGIL